MLNDVNTSKLIQIQILQIKKISRIIDLRMKKLFLYIGIGIALLAVPITVYVVGQNSDNRKKAAPASTLAFSPAATTVKAGDKFSLSIKLDTADNQVGLVQLKIVYDPAFLEVEDIANDTFAPSIRVSKKIDPTGKASITVGAKDTTHPINGSGTIAVISMKALKGSATPVLVKFTPSPDTAANALNETSQDVLIGRSPATITIKNADGSTPTANAITTISPSPIKTPTSTPKPGVATQSANLNLKSSTATDSASASNSAVLITSIKENERVATESPVIRGKGIPGSTVTIVIHSETEQTAVVTVDANGNWVYQPTTPLEEGNHTVEAMTTDPNTGATHTDTTEFVVASGNEAADVSTGSAIPVSGSVSTTILLSIVGALLLLVGIAIPVMGL